MGPCGATHPDAHVSRAASGMQCRADRRAGLHSGTRRPAHGTPETAAGRVKSEETGQRDETREENESEMALGNGGFVGKEKSDKTQLQYQKHEY